MGVADRATRFWAYVPTGLGPDECWPWDGPRNADAYGIYSFNAQKGGAHRFAWEFFHGRKIPKGLIACHACDFRPCVNPHHIWVGTNADNIRDAFEKGMRFVWEQLAVMRNSLSYVEYGRHGCLTDWVFHDPRIMRRAKELAAPAIAKQKSAIEAPRKINGVYRYGLWNGDPVGVSAVSGRCIASTMSMRREPRHIYLQCRRAAAVGDLCASHAKQQKWQQFQAQYQLTRDMLGRR